MQIGILKENKKQVGKEACFSIEKEKENGMRVRHKPWAKDLLNDHPEWVITSPHDYKGKWQQVFEKEQDLKIEIGTGKGQFLIGMAQAHPEVNFIGIEMISDVLVMALQKALDSQLPNLKFVRGDGQELTEMFEEDEVAGIYLNFSDPWPKKRHAKRRLTHKNFLQQYQTVMKENGQLIFKTDNQGLFEYSLMSLANYGMWLDEVSLDLHHADVGENIQTEYEEKFSRRGQRIYRLSAHFR
ncbi:tRNA (guanine-N(7)-)-methyltransferase [Aerococcus christensenii]|uniref:tRNA (guanine-N(7)-)-methyltransferase n=2 Tax=Aerococcus christensenii TaxID=87541 RepID=A0A133XTC6_9LACT|nr:tRNA (guanine-N(7)-)-methyltransferase [Aerococcus christensenii]